MTLAQPENVPWFGERVEPPEIGLPPERIAEIVQHELRGLPMSGFPIALQPFVVPRQSYRELLKATADLLDLLRRAAIHLAPDRAGRLAALGIDPRDCPMFVADDDFELRHCADMGRADVVIGADGPKFVEFNVSGAFGGMVHFQLYQRAWQRIRELAARPAFVGVDAFARLALLVERTCAELGVPPSVAIVGTPREWGPHCSTRHFDVQARMLRRHGVHAVHLDFEELLAGIGLADGGAVSIGSGPHAAGPRTQPGGPSLPLGLAEFTLQDAQDIGYDLSPVRSALDAGFLLIPSQSSRLLHSKKTLALLSEGLPWMTARDRRLVARYVPWSRLVADRKVDWRGSRHDLRRLVVDQQQAFVLKGATGFAGREVTFGARTAPRDWAEAVDLALGSGYFIVQEVVEAGRCPVDVMEESGEIVRIEANSVISPFCVGGAPAGCFARFVTDSQPGVISALTQAKLSCLLAEA